MPSDRVQRSKALRSARTAPRPVALPARRAPSTPYAPAAVGAYEIVELLGDEIDAIEKKIRAKVPKAQYLDLEAE